MRNRGGKVRVGTIILTLVVFFVFGLIVVWMFGGVSGEEFSPQKFVMRRFHYWQIPVVRIQIWPVSLSKIAGDEDALAKHIRSNRMTGMVQRQPAKWDIMTMDEVGQTSYRGDASILTNYLRQPGAVGLESLLDWTKANPTQAQDLWSIVARMAHEDVYPAIPNLLEAARRLEPNKDFIAQIRKLAAQEFRDFAQAEKVAGNVKRSAQLSKVAKEISAAPIPAVTPKEKQPVKESNKDNKPAEDAAESDEFPSDYP